MEKKILFRAVIEVIGKPAEHVEKAIKDYIEQLKKNERYEVVKKEFADVKKREEEEMWMAFAELEVKTAQIENLTAFCFDYMPSLIEIIEPKELKLNDTNFSQFLNDLQAKLHQVDMVAKQVKMENDILKKSISHLLKNYIIILLSKGNMTSHKLSQLTGVDKDKLEDFLDQLIDEERIDLKEGIYFLKEKSKKE